jgi:hypothetical protein
MQFNKVCDTFDLHSILMLVRSTYKIKELRGFNNEALEYLIEVNEKCINMLEDQNLKKQIYETYLNAFRDKRINFLPDKILESICNDQINKEHVHDFDPIYRLDSVIGISLLLYNSEFISNSNSLYSLIFKRVNDLV